MTARVQYYVAFRDEKIVLWVPKRPEKIFNFIYKNFISEYF